MLFVEVTHQLEFSTVRKPEHFRSGFKEKYFFLELNQCRIVIAGRTITFYIEQMITNRTGYQTVTEQHSYS
ncbi:hypothetical protein D3C77_787320 [compost metagenome]